MGFFHIEETESGVPRLRTHRFYYGGQAVIEGVMMRGQRHFAVAVRNPRGGITLKSEPLPRALYDSRLLRLPFLRGFVLLWDVLVLGIRTLMYSANVSMQVDEESSQRASAEIPSSVVFAMLALSLAFAVGLFFVAPLLVVSLVTQLAPSPFWSSVVEGVVRLAFFLAYLGGIGQMAQIKRTFQYHGAEHKTINALEAGARLDVEAVRPFPVEHPRCGTSLLLVVVVASIFVFAFLGHQPLAIRIVSRIVLVPVIASLAYEWIRFCASRWRLQLVRAVMRPALLLQKLTTREPDSGQIQVAIVALEHVLAADAEPRVLVRPEERVLAPA